MSAFARTIVASGLYWAFWFTSIIDWSAVMKWFLIRWHWFRFNWHWNRMKAIAARSCLTHKGLMDTNASYREHSFCYYESKNFLVTNGEYVTAISIIERKRNSA